MEEARDHRDGTSAPTEDASTAPAAERRVGAYRLVRELGHGGMGTVFLAARADDQYHKRVAIKIIRGADSDEVVRHFRRERQILAALEHPNIARLLDGGTTDDGLPYFVMEHVEGQPIDTYCDERKLSIRERLQLFQGVCGAVQHAHRNLVVHRDLKPGNILVTAEGVPKLLDFGIAKLLNAGLGGGGDTGTAFAMTPAYASPEQVRGRPVTTATDVYALGVVLYELLSGHRPYGRGAEQPLDLMKAVCEEEPEKPSTAVGRTEESTAPGGSRRTTTPESVSRTREGTPDRLRRRLKGDIDNIVLKALRKEPQQRYGSVEALAEDIGHYLEGRPVDAHTPTAWYRSSKFVRRHALGVAAVVTILLLAVGFGIAMGVQARRVARERDRAERLAEFMVDLFKVSDPSEARGNSITAREMLDRGAEKISRELRDDPETRAALMATMGRVYQGLGLYEQARPLLEESLRLRRTVHGDEHLDVAQAMSDLASLLVQRGDFEGADRLGGEALAMRRRLLGDEHVLVAKSLGNLGWRLHLKGDYPGAEASFRQALALSRKLLGDEALEVGDCLHGLAAPLWTQGKLAEAEACYRESLAIKTKLLGSGNPKLFNTMNNLAGVLYQKGDYEGAEAIFRDLLATNRRILGPQHPKLASSLNNLAGPLTKQGKSSEAASLYREAVSISRAALGRDHPDLAKALVNLAITMQDGPAGQEDDRARYAEAESLLREALAIQRKTLGGQHQEVAWTLDTIGKLLSKQGKDGDAKALYLEALSIRRKVFGSEHADVAESLSSIADLEARSQNFVEAERLAREALEIYQKALPADHQDTIRTELALGWYLTEQRRFQDAEPLLLHAYGFLRTKEPQSSNMAHSRVVALYEAWGKPDKAAQYRTPASK